MTCAGSGLGSVQIAASRSTIVQGSPTASLTCITADKTQEYRALPRASKACDMSASESCNVNTCGASFCCYCDTSGCYLEPCSVHKSDDPCLCRAGGGYPHPLQVHYLLSSSYGADCKATVRFLFRDGESDGVQHSWGCTASLIPLSASTTACCGKLAWQRCHDRYCTC